MKTRGLGRVRPWDEGGQTFAPEENLGGRPRPANLLQFLQYLTHAAVQAPLSARPVPPIFADSLMSDASFHVTHDPDASRFELVVDGYTAHLDTESK